MLQMLWMRLAQMHYQGPSAKNPEPLPASLRRELDPGAESAILSPVKLHSLGTNFGFEFVFREMESEIHGFGGSVDAVEEPSAFAEYHVCLGVRAVFHGPWVDVHAVVDLFRVSERGCCGFGHL